MKEKSKLTARQIALTAILLAICIVSQFFKNLNVFITGPIINAALILTAVYCGGICGIILSIITPVTSFFITGSAIMSAVPLMFPCIMLGNISLVLGVILIDKPLKKFIPKLSLPIAMVGGSVIKGVIMGLLIALIVLPNFLPAAMAGKLSALQYQFSIVQLLTALIGSVYAYIIKLVLDKAKVMG